MGRGGAKPDPYRPIAILSSEPRKLSVKLFNKFPEIMNIIVHTFMKLSTFYGQT